MGSGFFDFALFYMLLAWVAGGLFTGFIAAQKGFERGRWVTFGLVFPAIALLAAVGLPDRGNHR